MSSADRTRTEVTDLGLETRELSAAINKALKDEKRDEARALQGRLEVIQKRLKELNRTPKEEKAKGEEPKKKDEKEGGKEKKSGEKEGESK